MTIMEHVNGKERQGRVAPPLPEHTFKDSGITIRIRKVGPTTQQRLSQQIRKEYPEPEPPVVDMPSGAERNPDDPDYSAAMEQWKEKTRGELTQRLMLISALEAEVEIDDHARADIARKRRHLEIIGIPSDDNPKLTADENEKVFYILHVAAATPEDLGEFSQAVLRRSVPTEEAVQAQIATFQRDV